jgi:hypothetical protein
MSQFIKLLATNVCFADQSGQNVDDVFNAEAGVAARVATDPQDDEEDEVEDGAFGGAAGGAIAIAAAASDYDNFGLELADLEINDNSCREFKGDIYAAENRTTPSNFQVRT